jgi:hypothetical protein
VHQTLRVTLAMTGISQHVWSIHEIVSLAV